MTFWILDSLLFIVSDLDELNTVWMDGIIEVFSLPRENGEISFHEHLSALRRSCASATVGLDGGVQSCRLSMCLDAIHHIARAAIVPNGV